MALYHIHRPQTFDSIVGQYHIIRTLKNQVISGKVAHAYLFSGPRGIGKTTSARVLAKAVNCLDRKADDAEPCNTCSSCTSITDGRAIDIIEIDAASHTGVDNVRENIIDNARFRPTTAKMKVFIIDEVHMLSTGAFNALLKTLEEPPSHVMFILATTEKHKLPDTIISRCQRFDFENISYEDMRSHIVYIAKTEKVKINQSVIDRVIAKSDGCARDAVSLIDQLMATGEEDITDDIASSILPSSNIDELLRFTESMVNRSVDGGLSILREVCRTNINLDNFAKELINILRITLITKLDPTGDASGSYLSPDVKNQLSTITKQINGQELVKLIDLFVRRRQEIKSSPISVLPLELAVVEWCDTSPTTHELDTTRTDDASDSPQKKSKVTKKTTELPAITKTDKIEDVTRTDHKQNENIEKDNQKKPKTEISKTVKMDLTLDQVKASWEDFILALGNSSISIKFILRNAKIISKTNSTIEIGVPYKFHVDTLSETSCKKKIETTLSETLGCHTQVLFTACGDLDSSPVDPDILALASELGGVIA
jgi:DNA polymerase III subunit gamma/tau